MLQYNFEILIHFSANKPIPDFQTNVKGHFCYKPYGGTNKYWIIDLKLIFMSCQLCYYRNYFS